MELDPIAPIQVLRPGEEVAVDVPYWEDAENEPYFDIVEYHSFDRLSQQYRDLEHIEIEMDGLWGPDTAALAETDFAGEFWTYPNACVIEAAPRELTRLTLLERIEAEPEPE